MELGFMKDIIVLSLKKNYYFFLKILGNNYLKLVLILVFYSMTFFIRSNRQLFAHVNCDTRLFDY